MICIHAKIALIQIRNNPKYIADIIGGGFVVRKRVNTTKYEIIRLATRLFLEIGYSETSPRAICDELDISTGNLTYYFPSKEHLLSVLVEMLCEFQWKMMQSLVDEGHTSLLAVCLEIATMAAVCEEDEIAKDFYLSSYSHPMTLEIIRINDSKRAKQVFGEYCSHWNEENYAEAETLVSGIEFATLMTTNDSAPLDVRIAGAVNNILSIYNVPEDIRKQKINKVLGMDYLGVGKRILNEFRVFVEETNRRIFENINKF